MSANSSPLELPENLSSDEDWKDRVRAENRALDEAMKSKSDDSSQATAPQPGAPSASPNETGKPDETRIPDRPAARLPDADFLTLVSMLSTQAMVGLGVIPHPTTQKPDRQRELARHFIDLLGVLEEKTRGNLNPEEHEVLEATLHDLRMAFVRQ